jgi:hypothetical protein
LNDFLNETRTFHKKWSDYLKQFEINDQDLSPKPQNPAIIRMVDEKLYIR